MRFSLSPRDRRIRDLVVALDRADLPMAETWRVVGNAAENLGLPRPGYHLVRLLVRRHRLVQRVQAERRRAELAAAAAFFSPRVVDLAIAAERLRDAQRDEELVLNQHERSRGPD